MTTRASAPPTLFVHSKRSEWGRAVPIRSDDDWQTFVFEDGKERRFGRSHLHLLTSVELPQAEHATVVRALRAAVPAPSTKAPAAKKKKKAAAPAAKAPRPREDEGDE